MWWEPKLTDETWLSRIRSDYPEQANMHDDWLRTYYADGRRYAVLWDHTGDAYEQFEKLADAYLALKEERDREDRLLRADWHLEWDETYIWISPDGVPVAGSKDRAEAAQMAEEKMND